MPRPLAERPTPLVADRVHDGHADDVFEFLEFPHDDRPMRPGAGPGDIEMVAAACRLVAGVTVRGDPTLKGIRLPDEGAFNILFVWKLCLNGHSCVPVLPYRIILRSDRGDGKGGLVVLLLAERAR